MIDGNAKENADRPSAGSREDLLAFCRRTFGHLEPWQEAMLLKRWAQLNRFQRRLRLDRERPAK